MSLSRSAYIVLAIVLAGLLLFFVRMHFASGQDAGGDVEAGRLYTQAWCTECHSVQLETAGTGKFAPDFTVIAKRRSARWLKTFLRSEHKIMPDFVFKADQADAIVAYILSLKKS
jgi:hypothetical protein